MPSDSGTTSQDRDTRALVADFARSLSIEITAGSARKINDFRNHLATGTWVYLTSLPGSDFADMFASSKKLTDEGMIPVPHFTARGIADARVLDEQLDRLTADAGVSRVLAIAGSDHAPVGEFSDTISMLETGLFEKYQIRSIGIAGHPEDSPDLDRKLLDEHELRKLGFAHSSTIDMYILTQFVFDSKPLIDFATRIRANGNDLPIVAGLPGVASIQSLIHYARTCGIGPSMQFLLNRAKDLRKLLTVQAPDQLVLDLARHVAAKPDCGITGMHIFPLGGFEKSAAWANAVAAGEIELNPDGFSITGRADTSF